MNTSIAGRAVLAVVLMIGFYLLALAIAVGLLYIPYAEVTYAHRIHFKLALICGVSSLVILWSILPRFDKFDPPGPRLTREGHPKLFTELEGVAKSVGQEMPAEVYLVPDVNAWVMQRGGIMGFGSRRVMGLGLPLMQSLTCSQFRAVLAHEFGHYHSGDTKVGPWIYKTRGAIMRTLGSLGEGLLQLPFLWYGKMFLRITHAVSRRQEFVADELAARAVGSQPLCSGLIKIHSIAGAYDAFWRNDCAPVLNAGFRPSVAEGFRQFVQVERVAEAMHKELEDELKSGKADPYDTHPPLKERIAAVEHLPAGLPGPDDPFAATLLGDIPALEEELVTVMAGPEAAAKLQPIAWSEVGAQVYLPSWRKLVRPNAELLKGVTPESLPELARDLEAFGIRCRDMHGSLAEAEHRAELGCAIIGAAITLALIDRGGVVSAAPGKEISISLGSSTIEPFCCFQMLSKGEITPADWLARCSEFGVQGIDLSVIAASSA